jgi:hypothetical protein
MMVGCREDAEMIWEWDHNYPLPEGWSYLGHGEERVVYLSPDNVVYKLDNESGANMLEYFNICMIQTTNPLANWRVPEATLYKLNKFTQVIAMEYIDGQKPVMCGSVMTKSCVCTCNEFPCQGIEWEAVSVLWGVTDLNDDNVLITNDGTKVLVDVSR